MRRLVFLSLVILLLLSVATGDAKKLGRHKMVGQFLFVSPTLFDGSVIVAKDRSISKHQMVTNTHPIAGRLKFKYGKQEMIFTWPDSVFDGFIVNENIITGVYDYISPSNTLHVGPGIMIRLPMESNIIFHTEILRTKNTQMRGVVFFNYNKHVKRKNFKVAIYPRNSSGSLLKRVAPLKRLGFFQSKLPVDYDLVEAFVVRKEYVDSLPETTTNYPALTLDGTNVLSRDWRPKGFQIPKEY